MRKIINPNSFRIGYTKFAKMNWYTKDINNFGNLTRFNCLIYHYIQQFFLQLKNKKRINIYIGKIQIFWTNKQINILLDGIWTSLNMFFFEIYKYYTNKYIKKSNHKKKKNQNKNLNKLKKKQKITLLNTKKISFKNKQKILTRYFFYSKKKQRYIKKLWKISFLIFLHYWLNPLLLKIKIYLTKALTNWINKNSHNVNTLLIFNKHYFLNSNILGIIITNYLKRGYTLQNIFQRILRAISYEIKAGHILGIKVSIKGRIFQRGRSRYIWQQRGTLGISNRLRKIDYSNHLYLTKYSICSLKIWLIFSIHPQKKTFLSWI